MESNVKNKKKTVGWFNDLKLNCGGFPYIINYLKAKFNINTDSDNDINYFCRLIEVFSLFDESFKKIDLDYLWEQSKQIYKNVSPKILIKIFKHTFT